MILGLFAFLAAAVVAGGLSRTVFLDPISLVVVPAACVGAWLLGGLLGPLEERGLFAFVVAGGLGAALGLAAPLSGAAAVERVVSALVLAGLAGVYGVIALFAVLVLSLRVAPA